MYIIIFVCNITSQLKYKVFQRGDITFPAQFQKDRKELVAIVTCSQAAPWPRVPGTRPHPWDQGSWPWLQGNDATKNISFFRDGVEKNNVLL